MQNKTILISLLIISSTISVFAQNTTGLMSMPNLWNANQINPAFMPDAEVTVGLFSVRNSFFTSGPVYSDFIVEENGQNFIDFDNAIEAMDDNNLVWNNFDVQTLSLAIRIKENLLLSIGHSAHIFALGDYNKNLPELIYRGNAAYIGETMNLDNEFVFNSYNAYAVGAAYKFGNLTIGGKVKYLSGFRSAATDAGRNRASLFTDPDVYQITLESDYRLNSSGTIEYDGFDDFDFEAGVNNLSNELFSQNTGWAFDLGATLELNDQLMLSASITDLGGIRWEEDVRNYTSNGTFEYDGLDISDALVGNEVEDDDFGSILDTLENIFRAEESFDAYDVNLPSRINLGGQYEVTDRLMVGASYHLTQFRDYNLQAFGVSGRLQAFNWWSVGLTYATLFEKERHFNIGLSTIFDLGPVQIFAMTNNLSGLFNIDDAGYFQGQVGMNLQFGRKK